MLWVTISNPRTPTLTIFLHEGNARGDPRNGQELFLLRISKILSTKKLLRRTSKSAKIRMNKAKKCEWHFPIHAVSTFPSRKSARISEGERKYASLLHKHDCGAFLKAPRSEGTKLYDISNPRAFQLKFFSRARDTRGDPMDGQTRTC